MKQLILTFFAVILCFSLFFDKKSEKPIVDEINYIHEAPNISGLPYATPDTMNLITSIPAGQHFLHDAYAETCRPVVLY